ncbi:MAG: proton-conducting transporter membrane subunit [Planctomycetota bacterium]
MPETSNMLIQGLGLTVLIVPVLLLLALGLTTLLGRPIPERWVGRMVPSLIFVGLIAAAMILGWMLLKNTRREVIPVGTWVTIPHYHFAIKFQFDRLSVPLVLLSFILCGTIGAFANRYMHREPGYNRFFTLYALFLLGMVTTSLAGTIETLFAGWELVGLSSALLVAFFHERAAPVRNGLRVWGVYRIADAALLLASVALHHMRGEGDFDALLGAGVWPEGQSLVTPAQSLLVGGLLLFAAAGKSALVPFSGWLPRAMEGPTPSSAVFYGALSVHLGAFLLLRVSPIIESSPWLSAAVIGVGLATAILATMAGRTQCDIKSALSFASLAQVGLIVVEIGLGWHYVALTHILGHGCLRTLQFVRAPTLLLDYKMMEDAIGSRLPQKTLANQQFVSANMQHWFYRWALERGYLDALITDYILRPFLGFFRWCDRLECSWNQRLSGVQPTGQHPDDIPGSTLDDLL